MNQILKLYTWDEWPKEKRTHNYPKTRKKAIHKNSQKYHLLQAHPESYIEETWIKFGIYKAGDILDANPKVIWHLARERGWKRPLPDFLARASNWKISENYYIKEETNELHAKEK